MSLQETELECAANTKAPRVSIADIEAAVQHRIEFTGHDVVSLALLGLANGDRHTTSVASDGNAEIPRLLDTVRVLSVCILVTRNGFSVIGKSAPASPENFNADLGRKLAYEDAVRQLWPLMGFALREKLADQAGHNGNSLGLSPAAIAGV